MANMKVIDLRTAVDKTKQLTLQLEGGMRRVARGTLSMTVAVRTLASSTVVKRVKTPNGVARPLSYCEILWLPLCRYYDLNAGDQEDVNSRPSTATSQGSGKATSLSTALFSDRVQAAWPIADAILVRHLCYTTFSVRPNKYARERERESGREREHPTNLDRSIQFSDMWPNVEKLK